VNEEGAMKLVYGTLIRAAQKWHRITMDEADLMLLKSLRQAMYQQHHINYHDTRILLYMGSMTFFVFTQVLGLDLLRFPTTATFINTFIHYDVIAVQT
jgi:hypothetical protein